MNAVVLLPLLIPAMVWGIIGMTTAFQDKADITKMQSTEQHQQAEITTLKADLAKAGIIVK